VQPLSPDATYLLRNTVPDRLGRVSENSASFYRSLESIYQTQLSRGTGKLGGV